jgi:hypothetical protein
MASYLECWQLSVDGTDCYDLADTVWIYIYIYMTYNIYSVQWNFFI